MEKDDYKQLFARLGDLPLERTDLVWNVLLDDSVKANE
jgi:hypothetical protein